MNIIKEDKYMNCANCDRDLKPENILVGDFGILECPNCGSQYISMHVNWIKKEISEKFQKI